eukprot:TRINITY_DN4927_c0_g1_i1.p1 TRINITY_DN4927_c0_g1~~TRINITY_DN4927_c0_g1_i1.p1  ORF type:complete len:560 (+),score=59.21 TRINITY_DN4927_c0_g1_i1:90-1769(+)
MEDGRPKWRSKGAFFLAASSAGSGLSTLFRFPYLAYRYGGGTFLYPYLVCLVVLGLPMVILEVSMGQFSSRSIVDSMRDVHVRLKGVGYFAAVIGFVVCAYYVVVSSWSIFYIKDSFQYPLPWKVSAQDYFADKISPQQSTIGASHTTVLWPLVLGCAIEWAIVCAFLWKGVKTLGFAAYCTVPVAAVIVLILCIRALTLDGAGVGLKSFFAADAHRWGDQELWAAAVVQSFLSLGVGTGVLPCFGSYNNKNRDVVKWSLLIVFSNALYSVVCGLTAFALLGFVCEKTGTDLWQIDRQGIQLIFVVLPELVAELPGTVGNLFSLLLFICIIWLGVGTAIGYAFSVHTMVQDIYVNTPNPLVAVVICIAGFCLSFPFTISRGLQLVDVVNYYVPTLCITSLVVIECMGVGWMMDKTSLRQHVRERCNKGFQRFLDYLRVGCFYSITEMHKRITRLGKTKIHRIVFCFLVKYFCPIVSFIAMLEQLIQRLAHPDSIPVSGRQPWYIVIWGWLFPAVLLAVLVIISLPGRRKEEGAFWTVENEKDSIDDTHTPTEMRAVLQL